MPRELTSHKVNPLNEALTIRVLDEPIQGMASNFYEIVLREGGVIVGEWTISFQSGPIAAKGFDGLTNEALLAIVEDRLLSVQDGPFKCRENAIALTNLQTCMLFLGKRTTDRMRRGVEGTHEQ